MTTLVMTDTVPEGLRAVLRHLGDQATGPAHASAAMVPESPTTPANDHPPLIASLWRLSPRSVLAQLHPRAFSGENGDVPPLLLDACLRAALAATAEECSRTAELQRLVPTCVESFWLEDTVDWSHVWILARGDAASAIRFALSLIHEQRGLIGGLELVLTDPASGRVEPPAARLATTVTATPKPAGIAAQLGAASVGEQRAVLVRHLTGRVATALGVEAGEVTPDLNLLSLGFDSLLFLGLRTEIERELHVRLSAGAFFAAPTVDDVAKVILAQLAVPPSTVLEARVAERTPARSSPCGLRPSEHPEDGGPARQTCAACVVPPPEEGTPAVREVRRQ